MNLCLRRLPHTIAPLRAGVSCLLLFGLTLAAFPGSSRGDSGQDKRRERYEEILFRKPRKGAALEWLYKMHVEAMTLSSWVNELKSRFRSHPGDGHIALVCGLVLDLQGDREAAATYYDHAALLLPGDWYAPYCRGELSLFADEYDAAAASLTSSLERTREQENRLQIYPALGRCYLRSGRLEEAAEVWGRMSALNPADTQILEELAELLYDEGDIGGAASQYEKLLLDDDLSVYRRIEFTIKLAGLEVDRGRLGRALGLYDAALADLDPDSWMFHEVHAQIERMYHEQNDTAGLVEYYRKRIGHGSHNVELMFRLAEQLLLRDEMGEARGILERALERSPSRTDLRLRLASVCREMDDHGSAVSHLETVVSAHPDHADFRRELGWAWLVWMEGENHLEEAERWLRSIAETRPGDPDRAVQAARALADAGFHAAATEMYARAAELAPGVGDYHELLGEHLTNIGERDAALAAFHGVAAADMDRAGSLLRLAQVLDYHGFEEESLAAARESVELAPDDFDAGMAHLRLLVRRGAYDDALQESSRLKALAPNVYFGDELALQRIRLLARTDRLEGEYDILCARIEADEMFDSEAILLAARYAQALRLREQARSWVDRILEQPVVEPRVVSFAERIYQDVGDTEGQISLLQRLVKSEPARRMNHLKRMVSIYQRVGDLEGALGAASSFVNQVSASAEGYLMLSRVYASMGEYDEALVAMKRAIRLAPAVMPHRIELARMYEKQFMIPEAIETYWQVVDLSEDISGKLAVVRPLADLYFAQGRFPAMLERLRRMKRSARDSTVASLAIVSAYESVDDPDAARRELVDLAARRPDDVDVLSRLVGLSRREGDTNRAVAYHRKVVNLEPSAMNHKLLGDLYLDGGDREAALSAWRRGMSRMEADTDKLRVSRTFTWIDQLTRSGFFEEADEALDRLHRDDGDDWRVMFRLARVYLESGRLSLAIPLLQDLVLMPPPPSVEEGGPGAGSLGNRKPRPRNSAHRFPREFFTIRKILQVRPFATSSLGRGGGRQAAYDTTDDFGKTRAMAICMLAMLEGKDPDLDAWLQDLRHGSRSERHLLLQMAYSLDDPDFTEEIAREVIADYPEDRLARHMLITPTRSRLNAGLDDEFFETLRVESAWLGDTEPEFDWYYDWHALRMYSRADRREEALAAAGRLVERGSREAFILAQSMQALNEAGFYDVFEECVDGALSYYETWGSPKMRDELVSSFGSIAIQRLREDAENFHPSFRLFGKYLDHTDPGARPHRPGGGLSARQLQGLQGAEFPHATHWWGDRRLKMLRRVSQVLSEYGLEAEFEEFLKSRVDAVTELARITPLLGLAYHYWWRGQPERTDEVLCEVMEINPGDDDLLRSLAAFYEKVGDLDRALALVRRVQGRYGRAFKSTQQWILRLALDSGNREIASQTALALLRTRMSADELLDLSDYLVTLDHAEEARQAQSRAESLRNMVGRAQTTVSPRGSQTRQQRMQTYASRGNEEEAVLLARQSLRQLSRQRTLADVSLRELSIEVLRQFDQLEALIGETEKSLETTPKSRQLLELLFWCYRGDDREGEALDLLRRRLPDGVGGAEIRLRVAKVFFEEHRFEDVAEQLEAVLEDEPAALLGAQQNYRLLTQTFVQLKRTDRLAGLLRAIEPEDLLGKGKIFRKKRESLVTSMVNLARDCARNSSLESDVTLAVCDLVEGIMSSDHFRRPYGVDISHIRGEALEKLGRTEQAMLAFLRCLTDGEFWRRMGGKAPAFIAPNLLHGVDGSRAGLKATVLRAVKAARDCGRLQDLEVLALQEAEEEDAASAFILILCRIYGAADEPVEPWLDLALRSSDSDRTRDRGEWNRVIKRVLIAQAHVECGEPKFAADIFASVLARPLPKGNSGMEANIVGYFTSACIDSGQKERARNFLLSGLGTLVAETRRRATPDTQQLQRALSAMQRLSELGFYIDVMNIAQAVEFSSIPRSLEHFRLQATRLAEKIRKKHLPEVMRAGESGAIIAEVEREYEASPDDSSRWEKLLWLYAAALDTNRAAELRMKVAAQQPENAAWRHLLARSSLESGQYPEASDHYRVVLQLDPQLVLEKRDEYKELVQAFLASERMEEFYSLMKAVDYGEIVDSPGLNRQQRAVRLANLQALAQYCLQADIDAPGLALHIARAVRREILGRPTIGNHAKGLADTWLQAISRMEMAKGESVPQYLEILGSPSLAGAFGVQLSGPRVQQEWCLGMQWTREGVTGFLDNLFDELEASGQLPVFEEACLRALDAGETDKQYLLALSRLKQPPLLCTTALVARAMSGAARYRAPAGDRAYLLCLLGQELMRIGRAEEAAPVLKRAVDLNVASGQFSRTLDSMVYLARTYLQCNDREAAARVFDRPVILHASAGRRGRSNDQRADMHLNIAKKARTLGFYSIAWRHAGEVPRLFPFDSRNSRCVDAEKFIDQLLKDDLEAMKQEGTLRELQSHVEKQLESQPGNPRLIHHLYRILSAAESPEAAEVLTRLESVGSHDVDVLLLLGKIYAAKEDYGKAAEWKADLIRLKPFRLLGDEASCRTLLKVFRETGREEVLFRGIEDAASGRLSRIRKGDQRRGAMHGVMRFIRASCDEPFEYFEEALRLARVLDRYARGPRVSASDRLEVRKVLLDMYRVVGMEQQAYEMYAAVFSDEALRVALGVESAGDVGGAAWDLTWNKEGKLCGALTEFVTLAETTGQRASLAAACARSLAKDDRATVRVLHVAMTGGNLAANGAVTDFESLNCLLEGAWGDARKETRIRALLGQIYSESGEPFLAQSLNRSALDLAVENTFTSDEERLVFRVFESLLDTGEEGEAVSFLSAYPFGPQRESRSAGSLPVSQRAHFRRTIIDRLRDVGSPLHALVVTRRSAGDPELRSSAHLRTQFSDLKVEIAQGDIPRLQESDPEELEAARIRVVASMDEERFPGEILEVEYWIKRARNDHSGAEEIENRLLELMSADPWIQHEMAIYAKEREDFHRAVELFDGLLSGYPVFLFRSSGAYRDVGLCYVRAGRVDELVSKLPLDVAPHLVVSARGGHSIDPATLNQTILLAKRLQYSDLEAYKASYELAMALYQSYGAAAMAKASVSSAEEHTLLDAAESAGEAAFAALSHLPVRDDTWQIYLQAMATPAMRGGGADAVMPLWLSGIVADQRWTDAGVTSLLSRFLDECASLNRLAKYLGLCDSVPEGERTIEAWLGAVSLLWSSGHVGGEVIERARRSVQGVLVENRVYYLALLGQALLARGRVAEGTDCLEEAIACADESSTRITPLTLLLADTWRAADQAGQAREILLRDPWPADLVQGGDPVDALVREQHYWRVSEVLVEMEDAGAAIRGLHRVIDLCRESPGKGIYCEEAGHRLEALLAAAATGELTLPD